jgi:hypothetical protein
LRGRLELIPTEKSDVYTLAEFGDVESFRNKFILDNIIKKDELGTDCYITLLLEKTKIFRYF